MTTTPVTVPFNRGTVSYDISEYPAKFIFHPENSNNQWHLTPTSFQLHPSLVDACLSGNLILLKRFKCFISNFTIFVEDFQYVLNEIQQEKLQDSIFTLQHFVFNNPSMSPLPDVDPSHRHRRKFQFTARVDAISPIIYLHKTMKKSPPFRLMKIYEQDFYGEQPDKVNSTSVVIKGNALGLSQAIQPCNKIMLVVSLMKWCIDKEGMPSFVYVACCTNSIRLVKEITDIESTFKNTIEPLYSSHFRIEKVISPSTQLFTVVDIPLKQKTNLLLSFYPHNLCVAPKMELYCFNLRKIMCNGEDEPWGYVATLRSSVLTTKSTMSTSRNQIYSKYQPLAYTSIINRWYLAQYLHPNQPHPVLKLFNISSAKVIDQIIPINRIQRNPYQEFYETTSFDFDKTSYKNISEILTLCIDRCIPYTQYYEGANGTLCVKYTKFNHTLLAIFKDNNLHQNSNIRIPFHAIADQGITLPENDTACVVQVEYAAFSIMKLFSCEKLDAISNAQTRILNSSFILVSKKSVFLVMPHLFGFIKYSNKPLLMNKVCQGNLLVRQRLRFQKIKGNMFPFYVSLFEKNANIFHNNKMIIELKNLENINSQLHSIGGCSKEVSNIATAFCTIHNSKMASLTLCGWDEYRNSSACPDIIVANECNLTHCLVDQNTLQQLTKGSKEKEIYLTWNAVGNIKHSDGLGFRNIKHLQTHPTIVLSDLFDCNQINTMYCVQATLVSLSSVRCRMECSRCCIPLSTSRKSTNPKHDMNESQQLECPKNECNVKYFIVTWSLSGTLDDGTGQITLFAERRCALKLLRLMTDLSDEMVNVIERSCSTIDGGICYLASSPPDSLFKFRVNCISKAGMFYRKKRHRNSEVKELRNLFKSSGFIDDSATLSTVARFYLHYVSINLKHFEAIFYLSISRRKSQNQQTVNLSQGKSEFYVTSSQSRDFDRKPMMTTTLARIFVNMLDCRAINNEDSIRSIQEMISIVGNK